VTPQADSFRWRLGGVDYRQRTRERTCRKPTWETENDFLAFQHHVLRANLGRAGGRSGSDNSAVGRCERLAGRHSLGLGRPRGSRSLTAPPYETGSRKPNPWWHVEGKWFKGQFHGLCRWVPDLPRRYGVKVGDVLNVAATDKSTGMALTVVGILTTRPGRRMMRLLFRLPWRKPTANKPGNTGGCM